ncbi:MAG: Coenzyme F420 hydrogenase/dehydrogenase, beta subunit C-terminal domain [Rikenellaceae bacterium]
MIEIVNKRECCGCGACEQICPKRCISLIDDSEGFAYPHVDSKLCIECGLCTQVCPMLNQGDESKPIKVYASKSCDDSIREQSSSGGLFTLIATKTLNEGGVVFGARFNDRWEVEHVGVESCEELPALRGSKYVQSRIGESFSQAKQLLQGGRKVLFTGTHCQIAGLKRLLNREYENLLTIDFVCHGTPSPKVWRGYLNEVLERKDITLSDISKISFRHKEHGWRDYSLKIWAPHLVINETFSENIYLSGYLSALYSRPSCYCCPLKKGKSGSDITIADYWNIGAVAPSFDDDMGVSALLANSEKGLRHLSTIEATTIETTYKECRGNNGGFKRFLPIHPKRAQFFKGLDACDSLLEHIESHTPRTPRLARVQSKIVAFIQEWSPSSRM